MQPVSSKPTIVIVLIVPLALSLQFFSKFQLTVENVVLKKPVFIFEKMHPSLCQQ